MGDGIFVVDIACRLETQTLVEGLQVCLGADTNAAAGPGFQVESDSSLHQLPAEFKSTGEYLRVAEMPHVTWIAGKVVASLRNQYYMYFGVRRAPNNATIVQGRPYTRMTPTNNIDKDSGRC